MFSELSRASLNYNNQRMPRVPVPGFTKLKRVADLKSKIYVSGRARWRCVSFPEKRFYGRFFKPTREMGGV